MLLSTAFPLNKTSTNYGFNFKNIKNYFGYGLLSVYLRQAASALGGAVAHAGEERLGGRQQVEAKKWYILLKCVDMCRV